MNGRGYAATTALLVVVLVLLGSCSRLLGYGVLRWSAEDPAIPSGTVLPVYIKSNIDQVWVVGVPEQFRGADQKADKLELPLWQLEFVGGKNRAAKWAEQFGEFADRYAETMQDGLPVRAEPDNNARRVYRLREGQIVKLLARAEGNPAMSGETPLLGDWYRVLTDDGAEGFCFSYRLRLFEHSGGAIRRLEPVDQTAAEDPRLDAVLARTWSPEWYKPMVDERRIDLSRFSEKWGFRVDQDGGLVHLAFPEAERSFPFTGIKPEGENSWRFEGTSVQITRRGEDLLAVQYTETGGARRTLLFTALPADVGDLIVQETERRAAAFAAIHGLGPIFRSENYGTLAFTAEGGFIWTSFDLLVPAVIPAAARGTGRVELGLFLDPALLGLYDGAFTLHFGGAEPPYKVNFLYKMEAAGLRVEYAPPEAVDGVAVLRRAASPVVIYFYPSER